MAFIIPYRDILPQISETVFIAPTASVIGDAHIGDNSSIWFGTTIRGDVADIRIGRRTNIQDGCVVHVTRGRKGTHIGDEVTIGHMTLLHACTVEDLAFIGMGSVILDEAVVETGGMLAAGSLLTGGKRVRYGELWSGKPAKFWRKLTKEELDFFPVSAQNYVSLGEEYRKRQSSIPLIS